MRQPQDKTRANSPSSSTNTMLLWAPLMIVLLSLSSLNEKQVFCQELEDLNNQQQQQQQQRRLTNGGGNGFQFAQSQQQQFSSSRQFGGPQLVPQSSLQPTPLAVPNSAFIQQPQQVVGQQVANSQQRLSGSSLQPPFQRTNIPSRFVVSSTSGQIAASSQQQPTLVAPQSAPAPIAPNNVEQIMKNALSRAAKLEAEPRQDSYAQQDSVQSRQGAQFQPPAVEKAVAATAAPSASTTRQQQQQQQQQAETAAIESNAANLNNGDDGSAQTTTPSHETVYSDQRFANLFARRKTLNKAKFTPMETIRAKPTLPSFIKSLPDPKQFTAADGPDSGLASPPPRPVAAASSTNPIAASRPNRLNAAVSSSQQSKKTQAALTSNTANLANNKRNNSLAGKPAQINNQKTTNPKDSKAAASPTPASKPISNNPFSRNNSGNNNSNDPANVIAMARKRLLANNALESGKLKQQQQRPTASV